MISGLLAPAAPGHWLGVLPSFGERLLNTAADLTLALGLGASFAFILEQSVISFYVLTK